MPQRKRPALMLIFSRVSQESRTKMTYTSQYRVCNHEEVFKLELLNSLTLYENYME